MVIYKPIEVHKSVPYLYNALATTNINNSGNEKATCIIKAHHNYILHVAVGRHIHYWETQSCNYVKRHIVIYKYFI